MNPETPLDRLVASLTEAIYGMEGFWCFSADAAKALSRAMLDNRQTIMREPRRPIAQRIRPRNYRARSRR